VHLEVSSDFEYRLFPYISVGFVTEAKCVLCDLGTDFLCIIYTDVRLQCLSHVWVC